MRKSLRALLIVTMLSLMLMFMLMLFTSCGMGWQNFKKDFKSDIGGGLSRSITVSNMLTSDVVWEYEGVAYIDDSSTSGDVTIVYYDKFGSIKKADFIGAIYGIQSFEK